MCDKLSSFFQAVVPCSNKIFWHHIKKFSLVVSTVLLALGKRLDASAESRYELFCELYDISLKSSLVGMLIPTLNLLFRIVCMK